jgi:hypothetical protein
MKLIPLVDRFGAFRAWADRRSGLVSNPAGNPFALIEFDAVFRLSGTQIGWWFGDHIRDRYGRVVLTRPGVKIDGLAMPQPQKIPEPPKIHLPLGRSVLQWLLPPPVKQHAWGNLESLFSGGLERVRAFEERLRQQRRLAAHLWQDLCMHITPSKDAAEISHRRTSILCG